MENEEVKSVKKIDVTELVELLKENLVIAVKTREHDPYGSSRSVSIVVTLYFGDILISSSEDDVYIPE